MSDLVNCFLCQSFRGSTFADVVRHIGTVHAFEPGFSVVCGILGCPRRSTQPYTNFASYKKHLYRHHPELLKGYYHTVDSSSVVPQCCHPWSVENGTDSTTESQSEFSFSVSHREDLKRSAALFILKTAEVHKLTLTSVNEILGDVQQLVERTVLDMRWQIECALQNSQIDPNSIPGLTHIFDEEYLLNPFSCIQSEYLQMKYFRDTFGLIVSRIFYFLLTTFLLIIFILL